MNLIIFNFSWMSFNIYLALVAVIFAWLFIRARFWVLKIIYALVWFVFLPNTIYLFTDLLNLMNQWGRVGTIDRIVFVIQYVFLVMVGFVTFVLSEYPFQKFVTKKLGRVGNLADILLVILNFLVGFGIVLGRVARVNSWEVLTNPKNVLSSSIFVLSRLDTLFLVLLLGLFSNFSYFLLRDMVIKLFNICLSRLGASE